MGVGYVSDRSLDTFINDHFLDESFYNSLNVYDYRDNKVDGNGNRFVIVPKSTAVKVSLYTCKLGDDGRILVRASGTEPLLRVMVEAETQELCKKYVKKVIDAMKAVM